MTIIVIIYDDNYYLREYTAALLRLTRMIRGIGNPLVAVYARCYLCRVGMSVIDSELESRYLVENFYDFLNTYNHVSMRNKYRARSLKSYLLIIECRLLLLRVLRSSCIESAMRLNISRFKGTT